MQPSFVIGSASRIYIGPVNEILPEVLPKNRVAAISDAAIDRLHPELLASCETVLVGKGESIKTLQTIETVCRKFLEAGIDRSTFVLGIGGGIVTDITGFAASTYMRGVPFGFVPTTLLAQVDASVGGKNGVNVGGYKNMAGTFTQPRFVICDPSLLATLPVREFRAGLAEAVKAAVIGDAALFGLLEQSSFEELRSDPKRLEQVIEAAIRVKAAIVGRDERETGERRLLNLGHTLAHAIEKCSSQLNHGEAVAVGLRMMAAAAVRLGELSPADDERIGRLLERLGFVTTPPVAVERLLKEIGKDKKSDGAQLHAVLPLAIGRCEVRTVEKAQLKKWLI